MKRSIGCAGTLAVCLISCLSAQSTRFDDVVRNLRNPEPKVRLAAIRLLREAKQTEAIVPMASLINDPVDTIQLEAIAAALSFYLVQDVPEKRRLGFLVEVRNRGGAPTAFDLGPLAVWPRSAPQEVISALLKAVDDDNGRVRLEAIYAIGVLANGALRDEFQQPLIKALDHYDAAVRAGAARVAGRLNVKAADALIEAVNDSSPDVRYAAMRALGSIREERAVTALTDQLKYYGKGEGAWSALDGLAHIAHKSSVPVFTERLVDRDPNMRRAAAEGLGRTGDTSALGTIETAAGTDPSNIARAAMTYALQKLGRNTVPRLIEFLDEPKVTLQVQDYLLELGPGIEKDLVPNLQEPDPAIRAAIADVLGQLGGDASLTALQNLKDRDKDVAEAARRAVERIKIRRGL
jgi:HEAT repeat protein